MLQTNNTTFMKKFRILQGLALLSCAIIFMACPYNSNVPLSTADTKAPAFLIGTWEKQDDATIQVEIKQGGGNSLDVIKTTKSEDSEPTIENYTVHVTDINGTMFLNVSEKTEYEPSYYFYKVIREGENKMTLSGVTENIREKFEDSGAMKKFFAANMQNSYFYDATDESYFKLK